MADANEPSGASPGSVVEPVAWEVFLPGAGTYDILSFRWEAAAIAAALFSNEGTVAEITPLFRQPPLPLADAEREAIKWARIFLSDLEDLSPEATKKADMAYSVLTELLERTK